MNVTPAQVDLERGRHRLERHPGAGDERFEQHVAGTQLRTAATRRRMQAGNGHGAGRVDLAGDPFGIDGTLRFERDQCRLGILAIAALQGRLKRAQALRIHNSGPFRSGPATKRAGWSLLQGRLRLDHRNCCNIHDTTCGYRRRDHMGGPGAGPIRIGPTGSASTSPLVS